jgi:murein tripeptide amidase MpaA
MAPKDTTHGKFSVLYYCIVPYAARGYQATMKPSLSRAFSRLELRALSRLAATLSLALALVAGPARAQPADPREAPLPPLVTWKGASEALIVKADNRWITPSERTGLTTSPDYQETLAFARKLDAASPLLRIESFGRTPQGRDMFAIIARKPGPARKPVLLVQGGIHAGEIDGKDAGLMLLRDIAFGGKADLLDKADLVFVPIFNIDGHERTSRFNRPNQRGPVIQGWRTTAQNLNLNRDYLKADAPEMQAMIGLIRKYDPVLYLDLHVTDGTDHQYDIAYAFSGWNGLYAQSPAIGRWLDQRLRPAVDSALRKAGHTPGYYVSNADNNDPDKGIVHDADTPRFSTGYGDHRRLPTVLVETHSLKPYRQRVLGTYVLVEAALRLVGAEAANVQQAIATDRAARPGTITLSWKALAKPIDQIDFLGIAHDSYDSPAAGGKVIRWLGRPQTQRMDVYGVEPDVVKTLPVAWWVPSTAADVIARMRLHGIVMETIAAPKRIKVDMVRIIEPKLGAANEGHIPLTANRFEQQTREETFPAGSVRVPADQPLGLLVAAMLEPESPDSFLAWNFFPGILQRTEYIEPYAIAPLADRMLAADPKLRSEFEAKLAAEPAFAANMVARLQWFYARTPYYDDRFLLYPVGRERE